MPAATLRPTDPKQTITPPVIYLGKSSNRGGGEERQQTNKRRVVKHLLAWGYARWHRAAAALRALHVWQLQATCVSMQ